MYIFIDDSGDPGIKFGQGSTNFLVISAVIVESSEIVTQINKAIEASRIITNPKTGEIFNKYTKEYKYQQVKTNQKRKDLLFAAVKNLNFTIRAIVLDKRILYNQYLKGDPKRMQNVLLTQLLTHSYGEIRQATLVLDGDDSRAFGIKNEQEFIVEVNQLAGYEVINRITCADSKKHNLIQLADMVAGIIRNYHQNWTPNIDKDFLFFFEKYRSIWKVK